MFSYGAAFSIYMGKPWRATVLAAFSPAGVPGAGMLQVKLSDYPALLEVFGSVRIGFTPLDEFGQRPVGLYYPILINRASHSLFYALDSYCHHEGCVVPVYDAVDQVMVCPCHGSTYAIDGQLISDGPASGPLTRYPVTFDGVDTLSIRIPGLGYAVKATAVDGMGASRLKLQFPTFATMDYEVLFRSRITDPWSPSSFSLTTNGAADQNVLTGDDQPATIYVERTTPAGFFSVAIKTLDLTTL